MEYESPKLGGSTFSILPRINYRLLAWVVWRSRVGGVYQTFKLCHSERAQAWYCRLPMSEAETVCEIGGKHQAQETYRMGGWEMFRDELGSGWPAAAVLHT